MTVPSHIRVVYRGIFSGTPEGWSFGHHFRSDVTVGLDAEASDVHLDNVRDVFATYVTDPSAKWPSAAKLIDIRAYKIGTDGRMEGDPNILDVSAANIHGAGPSKYPPQVCLVMTHVAEHRGPARYGRCFLPTSADLDTGDLRVSVAQASALRELYVTFCKDVSDEVDLEGTESSDMLNISAVSGGHSQVVDHIECGRVLDTLRSRRRAMIEDRQVGTHIDW